MTNSNGVQLEVQLNTKTLKTSIAEVTDMLGSITTTASRIGSLINRALTPNLDGLSMAQVYMANISHNMAEVAEQMNALITLVTPQKESWFDSLMSGVDVFTTMAVARERLEGITGAINKGIKHVERYGGTFNIFKALIPSTLESFQSLSTGISKAFSNINLAMNGTTLIWGVVIGAIIAGIVLLIQNWDTVSAALVAGWDWLCTKIQAGFDFIQSIFTGVNTFLQGVFATDFTEQFGMFGNVLNAFFANVENVWNAVKSIFGGIVSFVKNVFAGDWGAAWDSIVGVFKGIWDYLVAVVKAPINGIIGIINGLVQGVVDGINLVIGALNSIHFEIPDWIPGLGGMTVGFQIQPLNAPKIPYLARGAVLPANKPFLAVLGDQRHGNNIEAPEGLIRDIFKEEMGDFLGGMMAGFEALLAENRSLRAVVECIEVGDTTIGQAANRYNDKMAVVRGRV